jgi:hypothetical protein
MDDHGGRQGPFQERSHFSHESAQARPFLCPWGWEYGADLLDQSCGSSNDFVQTKILGRFGFRIPGGFGLFCRRDALSRFEEPELVLNRQLNFCHPPSDSVNR